MRKPTRDIVIKSNDHQLRNIDHPSQYRPEGGPSRFFHLNPNGPQPGGDASFITDFLTGTMPVVMPQHPN